MKYLNQINFVLMLGGCLVVIYAFSVTYWKQGAQVSGTPALPQIEGPSEVPPAGSPIWRRSTTSSSPAIVGRTVTRRAMRPQAPQEGRSQLMREPVAGVANETEASSPREEPVEGESEGARMTRIGEAQRAVTVSRQAEDEAPSPEARPIWRGPPLEGENLPGQRPAPPAGAAEGQKRNEGRDPSAPPVRSSLMRRNPQ